MKIKNYIFLVPALLVNILSAKEYTGLQASQKIQGAEKIIMGTKSDIPEYISFRNESQINFSKFPGWAHDAFALSPEYNFRLLNSQTDTIGMTHYRYQETFNELPLEGTMF